MRKFYLLFVFVSLYSVGASAQIEGYYRVRNNGGGVDGKAYLNVQNERLEPTMTSDDVVSATNSVFYLKTGEKQGSNGLTTHNYYQVETFTSQGVDGQKMFKDIKATMQNKLLVNQLTFNAAWGIFKAALSADSTVNAQIDKINNAYGINLDDFTYEEYQKWVETFDTNLYVEEVNTAEQLLFGKGHRLYINFPDLPDPLRKGDSQDDLNTAMLLIGPLMKATIGDAIGLNGGSDEVDLLERRIAVLDKRTLELINESVSAGTDFESHEDEFRELSEEKHQLERRIAAIQESLADDESVKHRLSEIEATIEERARNKDSYDDTIVRQMIECIRVYHDGRLEIIFGGGHEVEEHL